MRRRKEKFSTTTCEKNVIETESFPQGSKSPQFFNRFSHRFSTEDPRKKIDAS
jgi:hypothetical protein